jgi:ABC-type transport system involved in cytochrome c biogenesis permease subunit
MNPSQFFLISACIIYAIAFGCYLAHFIKRTEKSPFLGFLFLFFAFLMQSTHLVLNAIAIGMLPVFSLAEALNFFGWTLIAVYLFISRRLATKNFPLLILPFVLTLTVIAINFYSEPNVPQLKTYEK